MYMERNEAPIPSSERNQRTEADERTRRELGSHAVTDQRPSRARELDMAPPLPWGAGMPESAKEYLREVASKAAQDAPAGLEKSRAVDAVMAVLVDWKNIEADLSDMADSRV